MTTPITIQPQALRTYFLGTPGAMQQIRTPNAAIQIPTSRSEISHDLINGGVAVTHRLRTRRQWSLAFAGLTPAVADQLMGFYVGIFGDGPFCFVDPAWRNALRTDASTFGAQLDTITAWSASISAQPLNFDTTVAAPSPQSGVLRWSSATNGAQVGLGTWNGTRFVPDQMAAPPYLPQVTTTISVSARSLSGTPSVSLRGQATALDGTVVNTQTATATVGSGAWTPLSVIVPASLSAAFTLPNLLCNTSTSILQFSVPQVQYGDLGPPDPWVIGLGIPRCVINAAMTSSYELLYARDHGITLAET